MELLSKDVIIKEILSIKNFESGFLESKTQKDLIVIRFGKMLNKNIEYRAKCEEKLHNLDSERFTKAILGNFEFSKIKEYYSDLILNKSLRIKIIKEISEKSTISKERLTKWSTKRLKDKVIKLNLMEQKDNIMNKLIKYGDGITKLSTPTYIQKQRYNFLVINGNMENSEDRFIISRKISQILKKMGKRPIYKSIMTTDINLLRLQLRDYQKDAYKTNLINYLLKYDYEEKFLKKQKIYVLEYLKSDLQPCEKGSRTALIRLLAARNIWSRNTIRNWDIDKLKHAYIKCIQDSYSPLSEYVPNRPLTKLEKEKEKNKDKHPRLNKTREEILKDITETLFIDLIN